MRVAVCFACNEVYMPLCKGLVLSLRELAPDASSGHDFSFHFVDIGCDGASLDWLRTRGVTIHRFSRAAYLPDISTELAPAYADAQLCRPFLPDLIPGFDAYHWMDCDIWLQDRDALSIPAGTLSAFPEAMLICPELHYGYMNHRNQRNAVAAHRHWYAALYGPEAAEELAFKPILNTGFFAMRAGHPLWKAWGEEIARAYAAGHAHDPAVLHYAEQLCLNKLLHENRAFLPLDPLFNYACGGSAVMLNPRDQAVVGYPPFQPLKTVHLLFFSRYGKDYLEKSLLYRKGAYLSAAERAALLSLVRRHT